MRSGQKRNRQLSKGDEEHGCRYDDFYLWHVEFCLGCIGLFQDIQDDKKRITAFSSKAEDRPKLKKPGIRNSDFFLLYWMVAENAYSRQFKKRKGEK